MGEYAPSAALKSKDEFHVLVTGFDMFLDHEANSSWLIAKSISSELLPTRQSSVRVHVHVRPTPLRVSYRYVREQVPPLLFSGDDDEEPKAIDCTRKDDDGKSPLKVGDKDSKTSPTADADHTESPKKVKPNFDLVLLLGMAGGRHYFTMETRAYRDGYVLPDVDGQQPVRDAYWKNLGAPESLDTELDISDVWRRWKEECMDEDVRPSTDPGRYLCGFSLYTALCEYWRRSVRRPVTFLHVPGETSKEALQRGKKVTEGLLRAMAESEAQRIG